MAFTSNSPLSKYGSGESFGNVLDSNRLNQPIEHIKAIEDYLGNNLGENPVDWVVTFHALGKIVEIEEDADGNPLPADVNGTFTDSRYYVELSVIKHDLKGDEKEALKIEKDEAIKKSLRTVIATNLAEIPSGTHSVATGDIVHVFRAIRELTPTPLVYYFFTSGGGDKLYIYQITGNCNKPATYIATGYPSNLETLQCADASISMPEGLTGGVDVLVVNLEESAHGGNTHWLATNSWGYGVAKGSDVDGWPKIVTQGGFYKEFPILALGQSDLPQRVNGNITPSANTAQWTRNTDDIAVSVYVATEVWNDPGPSGCPYQAPTLKVRKRQEGFDAGGRLIWITYDAETIIATGCCPASPGAQSPAFSAAFAQYEDSTYAKGSSSTLI